MDVPVDQAGQGETACMFGGLRAFGTRNVRDRAIGGFDRRSYSAIMPRIDDGDASNSKLAFGGAFGRRRSPQSKTVQQTRGNLLMFSKAYSECEYTLML